MKRMIGALLVLVWAAPASAHRLDEYLQATRLAIGVERVDVEIDLTPGVDMASTVLGWIDANRDDVLSNAESQAYARNVVRDLAVDVDGEPVTLAVTGVEYSQPDAMRAGAGMVRVRASAHLPSARAGRHRVTLRNRHRPESSVYLANVLVPDDARVAVGQQSRDRAQRELAVDYDVSAGVTRAWWLLGGVAVIGLLVAARRRSAQRAPA